MIPWKPYWHLVSSHGTCHAQSNTRRICLEINPFSPHVFLGIWNMGFILSVGCSFGIVMVFVASEILNLRILLPHCCSGDLWAAHIFEERLFSITCCFRSNGWVFKLRHSKTWQSRQFSGTGTIVNFTLYWWLSTKFGGNLGTVCSWLRNLYVEQTFSTDASVNIAV